MAFREKAKVDIWLHQIRDTPNKQILEKKLQKYIHSFICLKTRLDLKKNRNKKDILQYRLFFVCVQIHFLRISFFLSQICNLHMSMSALIQCTVLKHIYRKLAYLPIADFQLHTTLQDKWHQGSVTSKRFMLRQI